MNTLQIDTEGNTEFAEKLSGLSSGDEALLQGVSGLVRENADGVFVLDIVGLKGATKKGEPNKPKPSKSEMDDGDEGVALEVIRGS